ncbi:hypothetical protein PGAL8A_00072100 [Plasmodium gallinaceum]|uniref:F-box domain-containing protein n=1 Tax=Plasmodium gallinaceum TaxID=5849 RepID=A0A1J1GKW6_PLAGA|nr:hypothetical protein PGAL8A_00072100 [Plasmodium gallinaceum]CRG93017.1 hypothetical protein PGAL8A_00072100 [Plasmodium gallinaceum]
MNEFSSDIIKEILKFLTYRDVIKNKYLINKEFYYALNYNDLWKYFYKYEYYEDSINRKRNDPFKELFYIRCIEKKKNKYIDLPKSAQEQFLDMEASLLSLKDCSLNSFNNYDLYNDNSNNWYNNFNNSLNIFHLNYNTNIQLKRHSLSYKNTCKTEEKISSINEVSNLESVIKKKNENNLNMKIRLTYENVSNQDKNIHICSFKHCEFQFIQKNNLYICLTSKNFHVCDDKCDLSIFSDIEWGYLVCPISGKMFDYLSHLKSGNTFLRIRNNISSSLKYIWPNINENSFPYYSDEEKNEIEEQDDQEMEQYFEYSNSFFKRKNKKNKFCFISNIKKNNKAYKKIKKKEKSENYKNNLFKKILNSYKNKKKNNTKKIIPKM